MEKLARFGYAAKGVVYIVMGVLAVLVAVRLGGMTDQAGTPRAMESVPFGRAMLGVIAAGLLGYVLWRAVQAVADPNGDGADLRGISKRIGYAGSALIHAFFALTAASQALGQGDDWGSSSEEWTG